MHEEHGISVILETLVTWSVTESTVRSGGGREAGREGALGSLAQQLKEGEPCVEGTEARKSVWIPRVLGAGPLDFQATQPH